MSAPYPPPPGPYGGPPPMQPPQSPLPDPPPLAPMPGSVRAARISIFVMMALCLAMSVLIGVNGSSEEAGASFGSNLMGCVLFVLAFRFHTGGNGLRVTSIVLASMQILLALGATAQGIQGGIFALAGAVTIVSLLAQQTSAEWFRRPRHPGQPHPVGRADG